MIGPKAIGWGDMCKKLYSTLTMVTFRDRFLTIEAALTRLANKASKEGATKSGKNLTEKAPLAGLNTASNLDINVASNTGINAIYFGLVLSGYEFACINKPASAITLINQIQNYTGLAGARRYFGYTRQQSCEVYPFWPRAALLESAVFFMSAGHCMQFDYDQYCDYVMTRANITSDERNEDFFRWVRDFPKHLEIIKSDAFFQEADSKMDAMVSKLSATTSADNEKILAMLETLTTDVETGISNISVDICPLKCVYSADYFVRDTKMTVILGDFLPHSIVHEYLHLIVGPQVLMYKEKILAQFGNRLFDIDQSYYMNNDEHGFINAFEEHIVRKISNCILDEMEISVEQIIIDELAKSTNI